MTKHLTVFSMALLTLTLATGCNEVKNASSDKVSAAAASKLENEGKSLEASVMYARVGEILLAKPEGITHADDMFKKSLALNKQNDKANLYAAVISPVLTTKGFLPRFKKLLTDKKRANSIEKRIRQHDVSELIDFALVMPEGKKAVASVEEVRSFIKNEYIAELNNSLVKLDNIKSERFSLNLDLSSFKEARSASTTCVNDECEYVDSEKFNNLKFTVDKYDIKAVKIILKTQQTALTLATSVGLNGYENISTQLLSADKTDKSVVTAIKSQPNFLSINGSKEDLRNVFDHTEQIMNDLVDFSRISKEICYSAERKSDLISNICVSEVAAEQINELIMFVVGPKSVKVGVDENGDDVTVEVKLRALVDSKVSSIQELLPTRFDSHGKAVGFKDLTFGGIIPDGDLLEKLKTVVK